jgi:P27 family predicted phage terminase small subunit
MPTHLRLIRGNASKRPIRSEPQPARSLEIPQPPEFLARYAREEWYRVAPELYRLGLLTLVDVTALAAYCDAYGRWRTASEALAKMAERDATGRALLVKNADGNARQNPLVKIAANAAKDMLRFAGEFGLTPVARARIAAGVYAQPNGKFDGLLA